MECESNGMMRIGSFSREGAKTPSSDKILFSSKPLRLRAFAGDIPRFGCGFAAPGTSWCKVSIHPGREPTINPEEPVF
jgi:hypothetical protein